MGSIRVKNLDKLRTAVWMYARRIEDPTRHRRIFERQGYGFALACLLLHLTNVHKALGCLGTVTNGSIRDIPAVAEGFQMLAGSIAPSLAYVRVVEFGVSVTIYSMEVKSGDLIHADRHGAVVVPVEKIDAMQAALDGLMKQEARIVAAARAPGATVETIKAAFRG